MPTENGPYCNDPEPAPNPEQSIITPEDIEIDQLTCIEKQANYSVKYGDFLTNSEVELLNVKSLIDNPINTIKHETHNINEENDEFHEIRKSDSFTIFTHRTLPRMKEKKFSVPKKVKAVSPLKVTSPLSNNNNNLEKPNNKIIEIEISPKEVKPSLVTNNEAPNVPKRNNKIKILSEKTISEQVKVHGKLERVSPTLVLRARNKRKDPVESVDKQLTDAVTINDIFSLFSPNTATMSVTVNDQPVLEPSQTYQTNFITGVNENFVESKPVLLESQDLQKNAEVYLQVLPVSVAGAPNEQTSSFVPVDLGNFQSKPMSVQSTPKKNILNQTCEVSPIKQLYNSNKSIESSSPSISLSKNKIPPERVAAIEEKRKFNKKLRDMIEFCLDELEDPDKKNEGGSKKMVETDKMMKMPERQANNTKRNDTNVVQIDPDSAINVNHKDKIQQQKTARQPDMVNTQSLLQKSPTLKTADSYISILETRLQKMEDLLLHKIDQNSQKIAELKKSFSAPTVGKKSTLTQTSDNEEAYKKQLYQEISKYLSPNVNSSVYEELFLNRFSQRKSLEDAPMDLQMSPPKRRRRLR